VVTIYQFVTVGTFVQKIHQSSFVLMIISFLLAILFGPVFCGWVCPLGTIQEWVSSFGRKLFRRRFNHFVPAKLDKALRYLRYGVLAWVIYMTAVTGTLIFSEYDPYFALFNFWTSEVSIAGLVILGVTLGLSLFVERPWCKYACPYGAVLGLTNLFRVFGIRRNENTCKADGACSIMCPMNIPVDGKTVVRDHQCISCLECTSEAVCPVAKTVQFSARVAPRGAMGGAK
jgi:polyferredoxin